MVFPIGGHLEERNGELFIGSHSAQKIAEKFGTPTYVTNEQRVRENYRRLKTALGRFYPKNRIFYACKANTNVSILKILLKEGACIDAVSAGEIFLAKKAGFSGSQLLYTGTSVPDTELEYAAKSGATLNLDSLYQLEARLAKGTRVSFRINPEVGAGHHDHCITAGKDAKFGIWENEAVKAYRIAKEKDLDPVGIHMHIGSGIVHAAPFAAAVKKLLQIAGRVKKELGIEFEFIDIGGGFGVPYRNGEAPLDLDNFFKTVAGAFKGGLAEHSLGEPVLHVEPGRYLVADSTILLTKVAGVKSTPFKKFAGVDAGFNTLVRPAMYGSYHDIIPANNPSAKKTETFDIAGPLCESGDLLAKGRKLPPVKKGDVLAVLDAGAYGFSMGSRYNSRPLCAEVLVNGDSIEKIREAESLESLLENQKLASWLGGK